MTAPSSPRKDPQATRERLLDEAEIAFANHGYAGTSLRRITQAAKVNLAAVSYHFGSKEGLLKAVLERRVGPMNATRLKNLSEYLASLEPKEAPQTRVLVELLVRTPIVHFRSLGERGLAIQRFLGRSHSEPNELVQRLTRETFLEVFESFLRAFQKAHPDFTDSEIAWKMKAVIGILHFHLSASPTKSLVPGVFDLDPDALVQKVIDFGTAGFEKGFPTASSRKGDSV